MPSEEPEVKPRRASRICFLVLVSYVLLAVVTPSAAEIHVGFSPSVLSLDPGQSELVSVSVTGVGPPGIAAFQLQLSFDPAVISILDPNAGFPQVDAFAPLGGDPACTAVRGGATCDDPIWLLTSTGRIPLGASAIDNTAGSLQIAYGSSGAQVAAVADGALALIKVVAVTEALITLDLANPIVAGNQEPPARYSMTLGSLSISVGDGCTDTDGDGFGDPGSTACPQGGQMDCDDVDPKVNPLELERCRNGIDDNCDLLTDGEDDTCLSPTCFVVDGNQLTARAAANCPIAGTVSNFDMIWGDLENLTVAGGEVRLGPVRQIVCGANLDSQFFDNLDPDLGKVDFYLSRPTGNIDYGSSGTGLPRIADSGDCP